MSRARTTAAVLGALVALVTMTGCSSNSPAVEPTSHAPVAAPKPPRNGACYDLTVTEALQPANADTAVPCAGRHTARTVLVGTVRGTASGKPLALDSVRAQSQIAVRCRSRVDTYVGGSRETQRLSRVQAVWFSPSAAAIGQGARWFRCDLVIASSSKSYAALPRHARGLLASTSALDRFGTCGTAAPGTTAFQRVLCSARHTWRARSTIALPAHSKYLAKAVGKTADSQCRDVEARRAITLLKLRWSFEWPTRAQWQGGQRYGLCWTPDS